jgi:formylglycine-generating enzyme required for sulfatase activity
MENIRKVPIRVIVAMLGLVVLFAIVGLGLGQVMSRLYSSVQVSIPTVLLVIPPNTVPTLGLTILDSTGTPMVYVPPGCFMMGSNAPYSNASAGAAFRMCFATDYWIDKTDVTNAAYQKFIDGGGYTEQGSWWSDAGWSWLHSMDTQRPYNYDGFTDPQQPRVGIMWYQADAYCRWRGARLPTEPEWEYAARGPNSLTYPWGNTFDPSKVVYAANSGNYPVPVGSRPAGASWVGALDMSGNVFQWTSTAASEADPVKEVQKYYRYPYPGKRNRGLPSNGC